MTGEIKTTQMTQKQKETFDRMTNMVASFFKDADLPAIRGALRLAMREWEEKSGVSVSDAEKWPFEKYLNECCKSALTNFVERLIKQGYDRNTAMGQLEKLIDKVKESYGKKT
jgi:hypothetical protein